VTRQGTTHPTAAVQCLPLMHRVRMVRTGTEATRRRRQTRRKRRRREVPAGVEVALASRRRLQRSRCTSCSQVGGGLLLVWAEWSLIHPPAHLPTHSLAHPPTRSPHPPTHPLTRSPSPHLTHSRIHLTSSRLTSHTFFALSLPDENFPVGEEQAYAIYNLDRTTMDELRQKDDATMGEKLKFLRQAAEAHRQVCARDRAAMCCALTT
jgi:hypothetical protein